MYFDRLDWHMHGLSLHEPQHLFNLNALWPFYFGTNRPDAHVVTQETVFVNALGGADDLTIEAFSFSVDMGSGSDRLTTNDTAWFVHLGTGADKMIANGFSYLVDAGRGSDDVTINGAAHFVNMGNGADTLVANSYVYGIDMGRGADDLTLTSHAGFIDLGRGSDKAVLSELSQYIDGGRGRDALELTFEAGAVDILVGADSFIFSDRFSGAEMVVENIESFTFADRTFSESELRDAFGGDVPYIQVGGGTQVLTINDPDPTISVLWDRVVQQSVIDSDEPGGPTIASRAYAMMHTAMYDAWSSYDATAVRVSFDAEGDNVETTGTDADKEKAMSFAALTVLQNLYPDMGDLYETVMVERLGLSMTDDGSLAAQIGIDAAEDLLALRATDGSNQSGGYTDTTGYTPFNPGPEEINDITRWTPENVPIDPEDPPSEQSFLTAHWQGVETFAVKEDATGATDFSDVRPDAPQPFFTAAFSDATLDMNSATITLASDGMIDGVSVSAGDVIAVSKDLIGEVINEGFINQALDVIDYSANLNDEGKIIAEFWEDGGGTAFPPGTFMAFAQFVSARDDHDIDTDAQMFLAMSNAVMDAGIATWEAKIFYDYARPVRAIRDLGELGLIGEMGVDENTGETGYVIDAFGGFNPDGTGRGTQTILAENFVTFQRPEADPSPPFAEYTSGHSAFSAAGAEVLRLFTGSDAFGGSVTFAPGSTQFEQGVPLEETTLAWDTFSEAADEAGESRLFGGIHFEEGDINGRTLGATVGADAFDLAMLFVNGLATDADRPFFEI